MNTEKGVILIADDEESIRTLLQLTLEGAGHKVVTATDGQEALEKVSQGGVALALLDISMPRMSGIEVLRRLRAEYPDCGVIMVTGAVEIEPAVTAMKLGAYDYLTKPLNPDDLIARVQKALERRDLEMHVKRQRAVMEERLGEQTERVQFHFAELVKALAREHTLLYSHEPAPKSKGSKGSLSKLPPELQQPMASVDEFRDALIRILRRTQL